MSILLPLHRADVPKPVRGLWPTTSSRTFGIVSAVMNVFISYSRKDSAVAQEIALALRGGSNQVFIDTTSLKPSGEYHARIRQAIAECDLFVFLLSPNSVVRRGYALSELKIAKNLWPEPWGRVLPVMLRETKFETIDRYLTSVTILQPEGNVAADVATEVAHMGSTSVTSSRRPSPHECELVSGLLTLLEDRRLISDETGYQSHFPDHLRQSAADIRERTTTVLTKIPRTSPLAPVLKELQRGARDFQEATEGAMDGSRAGGGMTPYVPMGFPRYFEALAEYRHRIYSAMKDAAAHCGLMLNPSFAEATERGHRNLLSLAKSSRPRQKDDV